MVTETIQNAAWAIILTSTNDYIKGILTIKQALRHSNYPLLILHTPSVTPATLQLLSSAGCLLKPIEPILPTSKITYLFDRFADTWTKLRVWDQTDYRRLVLLDADMLPLQPLDHLMTLELGSHAIAACHACTCNPTRNPRYPASWHPSRCAYAGHPRHYFNSGLVVLEPSRVVFDRLMNSLRSIQDFSAYPFPDQDFLNEAFEASWLVLPYTYNALKTLPDAHPDLWRLEEVKNLHYIIQKPWMARVPEGDELKYKELYQLWWDVYDQVVVNKNQ